MSGSGGKTLIYYTPPPTIKGSAAHARATPFVNPALGVEQFFDPSGPGPTQLDRDNYNLAVGDKNSKTGFPAIDKKVADKLAASNTIGGQLSRAFNSLVASLQSTLITIIIVALIASFAFFALKRLAEKV